MALGNIHGVAASSSETRARELMAPDVGRRWLSNDASAR
jgi:hypothetical protein